MASAQGPFVHLRLRPGYRTAKDANPRSSAEISLDNRLYRAFFLSRLKTTPTG
jgi:hypothetical protein